MGTPPASYGLAGPGWRGSAITSGTLTVSSNATLPSGAGDGRRPLAVIRVKMTIVLSAWPLASAHQHRSDVPVHVEMAVEVVVDMVVPHVRRSSGIWP